jgi:hypothetical protein
MTTQTVREFSACGPCIPLGNLVSRSPNRVKFIDRYSGRVTSRFGFRVESGLIHTEPCVSCRDHARTQYPDGYMD